MEDPTVLSILEMLDNKYRGGFTNKRYCSKNIRWVKFLILNKLHMN